MSHIVIFIIIFSRIKYENLNKKKYNTIPHIQTVNFHALSLSQHPRKAPEKNSKGAFVRNMAARTAPFLFGRRASYISASNFLRAVENLIQPSSDNNLTFALFFLYIFFYFRFTCVAFPGPSPVHIFASLTRSIQSFFRATLSLRYRCFNFFYNKTIILIYVENI